MTDTANLGLPCIEGSQAQKHVTHNEALRILDTLVQLAVLDRDLTAPPGSPTEGQRWIVKSGATGAWAGRDNAIAAWQDGAWQFCPPQVGWLAYVMDEGALLAWDGAAWASAIEALTPTALNNMTLLGVGTTADATNPFSAKLNNTLFTAKTAAEGGDGDLRYKMSKEAAANTLLLLFQDNFSGRAEIGLTGDDDLHFKVSPDGTTWYDSIVIDKATGEVTFPNTSGASGVADPARQNFALALIYQAKLFGGYRRVVGQFADGYKASDGIDAGSSSGYSVNTSSGNVKPTLGTTAYPTGSHALGDSGVDRTSSITVTTTLNISSGTAANLVDGGLSTDATDAFVVSSASSAGVYLRFDFGAGASKVIQEATWYQSSSVTHGTWKWQGSDDASSWTDIGSPFTFGGSTTQTMTELAGNMTGYRYYQLIGVSGTYSQNPWYQEMEFKMADAPVAANSMTLVIAAQTADSTASNVRVLMEIGDSAAPTLNTDLTTEVSCDGGANWAAATLSSGGRSQNGRLMVETADTACAASGTSIKARIRTLNGKDVPIYGTSLSWH